MVQKVAFQRAKSHVLQAERTPFGKTTIAGPPKTTPPTADNNEQVKGK
jgi:hypothetical protein